MLRVETPASCPSNGDIWLNERSGEATDHFKLEAVDPLTGDIGRASTRIAFDGQELRANVIIRGFGAIEGRVYEEDGSPVAGFHPDAQGEEILYVVASNVSTGERYSTWIDPNGEFSFPRIYQSAGGQTFETPRPAVGNVVLQVVRASDAHTAVTTVNIPAAGETAFGDLVLVPPNRYEDVSGRIFERDGVTPASNVTVQVRARVLTGSDFIERTFSEAIVGATVTDSQGYFLFEDVPTGDVEVVVTRQSTFEQTRVKSTLSYLDPLELTFVLPGSGGAISGIVIDALGNPVAGAAVAGGPTLTETDAFGRFEIMGLPLSTFEVYAQSPDSPALGTAKVTIREPGEIQDGVVITLQPVGTIVGNVFESDGLTPVSNQRVQLWLEPDKGVMGETNTGPDGVYIFENYPAGNQYTVRAVRSNGGDGGMANTQIDTPGQVVDADIRFRGLATIRGRIVQRPNPVSPVTPTLADIVVVRKVWRILTKSSRSDNNYYLDYVEALAQDENFGDRVQDVLAAQRAEAPLNEFFTLTDELVLLKNVLPSGEFELPAGATGGSFRVVAWNGFLLPGEKRGEVPQNPDPYNPIVIDVGDVELATATGDVIARVLMPDGETLVGEGVIVDIQAYGGLGHLSLGGEAVPVPSLPQLDPLVTGPDGTVRFPIVTRGAVSLTADTDVVDPAIRATTGAEIQTDVFEDEFGNRALNVRLFGRARGSVPAGGTLNVDLVLSAAAAVDVQIFQNDGMTPVSQPQVTLVTSSPLDEDLDPDFRNQTASVDGTIDFLPVIAGEFSVNVTDPVTNVMGRAAGVIPDDPPPGHVASVVVTLGAVTTASGNVVQTPQFGTVRGVVHRADGEVLDTPAEVVLRVAGVRLLGTYEPDLGEYAISDVPVGLVQVDVLEPFTARRGVASGTLRDQDEVITIDVTLVGLGTVTGRVLENDGDVDPTASDVLLFPAGNFSDRIATRSDSGGEYDLPGVPLGDYIVQASEPISKRTGSADGEMVSDGDINTTDVYLNATGTIRGTIYGPGVFFDEFGNTVDVLGDPWPDAPRAADPQIRLQRGSFFQDVTGSAQGEYVSSSTIPLPLGTYSVTARTPSVDAMTNDGGRAVTELTFHEEDQILDFALRGYGKVSGRVLDSLGIGPVVSARVTLSNSSPFAGMARTVFTDPDGLFVFDGVQVGNVTLTVESTIGEPKLGGAASGVLADHEQVLEFFDDDDDEAHEAIRLQAAGRIEGRVVSSEGVPVDGASVILSSGSLRLARASGQEVESEVIEAGEFVFDGVPLGTYQLAIEDPVSDGFAAAVARVVSNGILIDFGDLPLDSAPPTVTSVLPFDGEAALGPDAVVEIQFSEPMNPATIDASSIQVSIDGTRLAGEISVSADRAAVTFTPGSPLPDRRLVVVEVFGDKLNFEGAVVDPGVRDPSGLSLFGTFRSSFTTGDNTAPVVISRSPAPGDTDVDPRQPVRIEFNEAIDVESISAFELDGPTGSVPGVFQAVSSFGERAFVFIPDAALATDTTYTATVSGPVADVVGNAMAAGSIVWSFESQDTLPPTIESVAVANGDAIIEGNTVRIVAQPSAGVDDVDRVEFRVAGQLVATSHAEPFDFELELADSFEGSVVVSAIAVDIFGNESDEFELTIAPAPNLLPTVEVLSPAAGVVSQGQTIQLRVVAGDDLGLARVAFTAAGGAVASGTRLLSGTTFADEVFEFTLPASIASGSTVTLSASAKDVLGLSILSSSVVLTVADQLAPVISIDTPAARTILDPGESFDVIVTASDASGVEQIDFSSSGLIVASAAETFPAAGLSETASFSLTVPVDAPDAASFTLVATARDGVGLIGSTSRTVRAADDNPPVVAIASLAPDANVESGEVVSLQLDASDNVSLDRIVIGIGGQTALDLAYVDQTSVSTTVQISIPSPSIVGADLALTATAFDEDGNQSSASPIVVTVVDETLPVVAWVDSLSNADPGESVSLQLEATDVQGIASISCEISGAAVASVASSFGGVSPAVLGCDFVVPTDAPPGATITIAGQAIDSGAANPAAAPGRTLTVNDVVCPVVVSTDPAADETGVGIERFVGRVTFDEIVDDASARAGLALVGPAGEVPTTLVRESGGRAYRFEATEILEVESDYTYEASGVTDLLGNAQSSPFAATFMTSSDELGPCLQFIVPSESTLDRSIAPEIIVAFAELLDPESVNDSVVRVFASSDGADVPLSARIGGVGERVIATPRQPLVAGAEYQVEVSRELRDVLGNLARTQDMCIGSPDDESLVVAPPTRFEVGAFSIIEPAPGLVFVEGEPVLVRLESQGRLGVTESDVFVGGVSVGNATEPALSTTIVMPTIATVGETSTSISATGQLGSSGNLAPLGVATQSGTDALDPRPASLAIDGDGTGDLALGSVTLASSTPRAWWDLDLGSPKPVESIELFLRTDCCEDRNRIRVLVALTPFDGD